MIISFESAKGGVGKTTLSREYAGWVARMGAKTYLVDSDENKSTMLWSENREMSLPEGMKIAFLTKNTLYRDIRREQEDYQQIVIDSPPGNKELNRSIIAVSDFVIIPTTPSTYDLSLAMQTAKLCQEAQIFNEKLKFFIVINRKITGTLIAKDAVDYLNSQGMEDYVLTSEISERVVFAQSSNGYFVHELEPKGKAVTELNSFFKELSLKGEIT